MWQGLLNFHILCFLPFCLFISFHFNFFLFYCSCTFSCLHHQPVHWHQLQLLPLSVSHRGGAEHFSNFCIPMFQRYMTSHPVANSAELVDQGRFKMDACCHLVSSLFSPTVNHDFVCCVLSMLQRYFASYFSQYFVKTNMLSIILTINDTQLRGMSWRFFAHFQNEWRSRFWLLGFLIH